MMDCTLRIRDLAFHWPGQPAACLDIADFSLTAGERLFLYGPSGSGKSTLLNLLGGVTIAQRGSVEVLGQELGKRSARQRDRLRADHIGFIFQQFNLLPWLSAIDNALLPCTFSPRRRQRATRHGSPRAEAERLMAHLDLAPALWTKRAADLSIGEQQRVAAVRALIGQPEVIFADEPTSALDAERQQVFVDLLLEEAASVGAALIFVSHDHRLAKHFDRQLALHEINQAGGVAQ